MELLRYQEAFHIRSSVENWRSLPIGLATVNEIPKRLPFYLGFTVASLVYGGLHLTAWDAPFPTSTQQLLWRMSSIALTAFGIPLVIYESLSICVLGELIERGGRWLRWPWAIYLANNLSISLLVGRALSVKFYCLCRVFLVVECFIMLFHLPDSVYEVPQWSRYIPHII